MLTKNLKIIDTETVLAAPDCAAIHNAVHPSRVVISNSAPRSISNVINLGRLDRAAKMSGVRPVWSAIRFQFNQSSNLDSLDNH